ncbi:MAG: transposase family protein, partial [Planctomycetes bacterium]|nr:transposase family protein [Planctomycetota bacterium]
LVQNSGLSHLSDTNLRTLLDKTDHYLNIYESHTQILPRQYAEWHDGFESDPTTHYRSLLATACDSDASEDYSPSQASQNSADSDLKDSDISLSSSDIEILEKSVTKRRKSRTNSHKTKRKLKRKRACMTTAHKPVLKPKPHKRARYKYVYSDHLPQQNDSNTNLPEPLTIRDDPEVIDSEIAAIKADLFADETIHSSVIVENARTDAQNAQIAAEIRAQKPQKLHSVPDTTNNALNEMNEINNGDAAPFIMPIADFEAQRRSDWDEHQLQSRSNPHFAQDEVIDMPYAYPPVKPAHSAFSKFRNLPSPPPYTQPKDNITVRECAYKMRQSTIAQSTPLTRHKPLLIRDNDTFRNNDLKSQANRDKRQQMIESHSEYNQTIFAHKPTEHVWNANVFLPRYVVPIAEYGSVLSENTHTSRTLLRLKQRENAYLWGIIHFLKTGNNLIPKDFPLYLKRYVMAGRFAIDSHDILCWKYGQSRTLLRVIPPALRQSLINSAHSGHSRFRHKQAYHLHHGSGKMLTLLRHTMRYWWPKMEQHIKMHCRCCNTCQHIKPGIYSKWRKGGRMQLFVATRPFEQISVDIVGPLPTSHSNNRYIVSMIDSFSRYCMLVPVKSVTAMDIVHAIDRWVTTFGPPKSILSDNGPQFISAIYRDYN